MSSNSTLKRKNRFAISLAALLLGAVSLCHASSLQDRQVAFEKAYKLFNDKNYEAAYNILETLNEQSSDDPRINFFLGRAALELKKYDEAVAAFERVLIVEPTQLRSRLEMARAYFEQKEFLQAEAEFDKALEQDMPSQVKQQVLAYKDSINKSKQTHFFNGSLSFGVGYDSNTNNGIGTKDYTIPSLNIAVTGDKASMDYFSTQSLGVNHIWDMKSIKNGLYWQDSATVYLQTFRQNSDKNSRYFALNSGAGYKSGSYDTSLSLVLDKLIYGGEAYFYSFGLAPKLSYKLSDRYILEGGYSLKKKLFDKAVNSDKDAFVQDFSLGIRQLIASTGSVLSYTISDSREREITSNTRSDISFDAKQLAVSVFHPLRDRLDMTAGLSYKKTDYDDTDTFFLKKESSATVSANIGLIRTLDKNSMLSGTVSYQKNSANMDNKDYDKKGVSINYVYNF